MNIGALIPVRLQSERLPGKALAELAGRPMITHLLDRVFASRFIKPENVIVCTTEESPDDPLIPVVEEYGAHVFRGSTDDIIDRFYRAVERHGFDAVLQADGDDPCTDTGYMDRCMQRLLDNPDLDIVYGRGLPLGTASKAIRARAIRRVWEHHATEKNDTGFIYYFTRTELCRAEALGPVSAAHVHERARLTLDYPQDLEFFRALFAALHVEGRVFGVADIVACLNAHPEILAINQGLDEEYARRTAEKAVLEYRKDGERKEIDPS